MTGARLGLLHTVPALAVTFDDLLKRTGHGGPIVHVVDAGLLAAAVDHGVDDEVRAEVLRHVRHLADDGADAILVTCSSIGEAVEEAARRVDVPVLRVDATMAEEAVALAADRAQGDRSGRIAVLATLAATLGPTGRLLESRVREASSPVEVTARVVGGAAAARASGDQAGHDRLVADAIAEAASSADVVVLAQASMAAAAAGLDLDVPVLTSPEGGAAALVAAVTRLPS
ncbi:aspartate/glutamate racemase family protein [Naasia sp. SYSU D00948]|uniref:aspartate/glutamate racemase family protein n=1 Tax=Naasia sp. SYSU D00948 TaxID=2817379 RepID=UPI001B31027C|nr:aspartate/glutamate racemase family protein [Naasia sp. SYSU D00948]